MHTLSTQSQPDIRPRLAHPPLFMNRRRVTAALALLALVAILSSQSDLQTITDWLGHLGPVPFTIAATLLMSTCVPKTMIAVAAGALFGEVTGSVIILAVCTVAAISNYQLGYWLAHRRAFVPAESDTPESSTQKFTTAVIAVAADAGWFTHFLIRLSPIPTMIISYSMGMIGARLGPYMVAAILAAAPQILWIKSGVAARIATQSDSHSAWPQLLLSLSVAIIATFLITHQAQRRLDAHMRLQSEAAT